MIQKNPKFFIKKYIVIAQSNLSLLNALVNFKPYPIFGTKSFKQSGPGIRPIKVAKDSPSISFSKEKGKPIETYIIANIYKA